jgi:crossover junction endonuclease MUS81
MQLLIDFREKWVVKKLLELSNVTDTTPNACSVNGVDINYCTVNLEVGDFVIKNSDGNVLVIIERKSVRDLCASITDGRFRQQKERLLESTNDPCKVLYIIEGHKGSVGSQKGVSQKGVLSQTIIDGSIHNLLFRHNFKVLWTENESDTLNNIALLYKKYNKGEFDTTPQQVAPTKLVAKGVKISDNIFALQLSAIPGVSYSAALQLSKVYKNMKELVDAYNELETEIDKEKMLINVQLNETRKVGNALSKKIYVCVHDT